MDRRNWLWRRKSSERSPSGETESPGSLSSHSERFSDDQVNLFFFISIQTSNHNSQSPEITSKVISGDEEQDASLETQSEKLSEALLDIRAKEDLVKQHAKVAEEAVAGWERAENEVLILKKQNEVLTQKNLILEGRIGHLDGALKECLRQLRQAREDQEEKIYDAIAKKSREWELTRSELENQIAKLHSQLPNAKLDACSNLEALEKENSILKLNLLSKDRELALRTSERDLSALAAESASKQHLESIKKVSKLEAECRKLKVVTQRSTLVKDHRSLSASSVYAESLTDSQSDGGERLPVYESRSSKMDGLESIDDDSCQKSPWESALVVGQIYTNRTLERSLVNPSVEIDLMNDFLEMERILASPETQSVGDHPCTVVNDREDHMKIELEAMINWTAKLEEKFQKMGSEKINLEMALTECQIQLKKSEDQLKETEAKLVDMSTQLTAANQDKIAVQKEVTILKEKLNNSTRLLDEAKVHASQVRNQLMDSNQAKRLVLVELENANKTKAEAESQLKVLKLELDEAKVDALQVRNQLIDSYQEKRLVLVELESANVRKTEAEEQLKVVKLELETLRSNNFSLEKEVEEERKLSSDSISKCKKLENEMSRMAMESKLQSSAIVEEFRINQDKELEVAASKFADCQNTITSIGRQLKYLASIDDFLFDSDKKTVEVL
ncbi:filament-like plant protein 3 [Dorcoceras hygrometricum]|uniref:Filament-like plant protein 3 n=1 Tax=Dorcoceras hygrometricum TaxID=472368 RepID=A0A2Z7CRX7_9LAMI|nr:filament-like plant protein 3 [Dorcoceras hygrometricum]